MTSAAIPAFAFAAGGPLRRLEQRLGLARQDDRDWLRQAVAAALLAYAPAMVLGLLWWAWTAEWPALLARWDTHVRWLAAAPLLFLAEQGVDRRARGVSEYLFRSGVLPAGECDAYRRVARWTERLRDSAAAEGLLLALAVGSAWVDARGIAGLPLPHWWSGTIAVTFFRFLLLRWIWRWLLWFLFLGRLSHLPIQLSGLHPDRLAGLEPLLGPSYPLCIAIAAGAAVMAGQFADRMFHDGVALTAFYPQIAVYGVLAYGLAAAPIWMFAGPLARVRRREMHRYGAFAARYCEAFEQRWLGRPAPQSLGVLDIQSLADLDRSFETAAQTQVVAVSRRLAIGVLGALLVPMLPLVLTQIRFADLVIALARGLL